MITDDVTQLARLNMVEQQIRPWDVFSLPVLDLFMRLQREDFVAAEHRSLAFSDLELPLPRGEKMMSPKMEARVLQSLQLQPEHRVFELGSGSGYLSACLASLAAHVDSVEWHGELCALAADNLARAGINNVTLEQGDASQGWKTGEILYDAIAITAAFPHYPEQFEAMLKPGGRMFVIIGKAPAMQALQVVLGADGSSHRKVLFETCIDRAHGLPPASPFTF